ncbi:MAG: N-acetylmuramic acid 6-phosphate etherase [Verrucomicrobiales bacterium]
MLRATKANATARFFLGIEGGATRTSVLMVDGADRTATAFQLGPCNVRMMADDQLIGHFRAVARRLPVAPAALAGMAVGLAGARTAAENDRIRRAAARVFPRVPCVATNDLETALAAAPAQSHAAARVLVLSGTGSCCFGRSADGRTARVGGRGHVIGDRGSAWDIGQRALRELLAYFDHEGQWPKLGALVLDALALNHPEDLIPWSMQAEKDEIASLAVQAFRAARQGDPVARDILEGAAESLAADGNACAGKLVSHAAAVHFVFNGSVLTRNPGFAQKVARRLKELWPGAKITILERPSVWGAVELARNAAGVNALPAPISLTDVQTSQFANAPLFDEALASSPTEQRNPRSAHFDTMPIPEAVDLMLDEERRVPDALRAERESIVWVVQRIVRSFKKGGRLFYVGAGTSGRLGVLDASECPPTFRAPREQVQGIIAGGLPALWRAVEGAEDDVEGGAEAICFRNVTSRDVVIGIAASGRTPFVWGALAEAKSRRATTVLIAFNPAVKNKLTIRAAELLDQTIAVSLGPEVLTGSTRLKAGTATKLLLNIFTTVAMSRVGKVIGNLMIDLNPSNVKLRDRAVRIVCDLTGADPAAARAALEKTGWVVKKAYYSLRRKTARKVK